MYEQMRDEIDRMQNILLASGFRSPLAGPASPEQIAQAEVKTGIQFDDALRALYSLCNGSQGCECLAVQTDELTPCSLASLDEAVRWWQEWLPYNEAIDKQFGPGEMKRDRRIRPNKNVHRGWLPFAEFNGWSTAVYFDIDPSPHGSYGQIIVYQHDPDALYYVAANVLEFLRISNDQLESHVSQLLFVDGEPAVSAPPRAVSEK